jgi:general secretion pathway protein A
VYLDFYGLREHPFGATPDPRFLYLSPGHREALAQLVYGVQERKGFLVLVGEVGTGKTTLLHALRQRLDRATAVAFVFHSTLRFEGLLDYVLEDLGVPRRPGDGPAQGLIALNQFLVERRRAGQNTVLVIDEAQNLDVPTLEQVRLLSNFETPTEKLLQIVLVGQPELAARLRLPELRQLRQRIALRAGIAPLTAAETEEYIRRRVRAAGGRDLRLFAPDAVRRIAQYARGVPRVVNAVCDHCFLVGYAAQEPRISRQIVEEAIRYREGAGIEPPRSRWRLGWRPAAGRGWALGALGLAVAGGLAAATVAVGAADTLSGHLLALARSAHHLVQP